MPKNGIPRCKKCGHRETIHREKEPYGCLGFSCECDRMEYDISPIRPVEI